MAKRTRNIIEINEERCNGCGQCVNACAEGAIALVDGKAKIIADIYCDGLGNCLQGCPMGALRIVQREADDFDRDAVRDHLSRQGKADPAGLHAAPGGQSGCSCPGAAPVSFTPLPMQGGAAPDTLDACEGIPGPNAAGGPGVRYWPLKIRLMHEGAPFLRGADLLVAADCAAFAAPGFHQRLADGKVILIGCPKFDGSAALAQKLAAIIDEAEPESLLVARMEVPCCRGLGEACYEALRVTGEDIPLREVIVTRAGGIN